MLKFVWVACAVFAFSQSAEAQRVHAPHITGIEKPAEQTDETVIYTLTRDKIHKIETTDRIIHVQLNQEARDDFYRATYFNIGKKMIIKLTSGITFQEAWLNKAFETGYIVSKPFENFARMQHVVRSLSPEKKENKKASN